MADKFTNVCSICRDNFTKPKLLSCSHTFCQECLKQLVKSQYNNGNTFRCPMCRDHIIIPVGGVENFKNNFYITDKSEDNAANSENKCMDHNSTRDVYCKACNMCICSKCYMATHSGHKYFDLSSEELKKTTKQELNSLKQNVKLKLDDYIQTSNHFDSLMSELSETALSTCHEIDIHSATICSNVTQSADNLKKKVNDWRKEEFNKLNLQKEKIDTQKQEAHKHTTLLNTNLQKQSLVDIWPNLIKFQQEISAFCKKPIEHVLPVSRLVKFKAGEINCLYLQQQCGYIDVYELPGQSPPDLVEGNTYNFKTVYNIKDIRYNGNKLWGIRVCFYNNEVYCDIKLDGDLIKHIKDLTVDITYKLLNQLDNNQTIHQAYRGPVDGLHSYVNLIKHDVLSDPTKGFIDSTGNFSIHTIVNITELVKI